MADYLLDHANGDETDETVMFEYAEIKETLRLEYLYTKESSYLDFFKTKGNRYRLFLIATLGLFSQWSGNGLTSYYFTKIMDSIGVTSSDTQFKINGSLTIVSLLVSVSCAFLIDRVGRRKLFLVATSGMLICFVCWTICTALYELHGNLAAGKAVIAFIFFFSIAYAFAWSGLLVAYTVEIMPFKLRAKGLMVMNFFVNAALVFNQYINPIGLKKLTPSWKFYTIYCCWIAVELIVVFFFYIETKGVSCSVPIHSSTCSDVPYSQPLRRLRRFSTARMPMSVSPTFRRSRLPCVVAASTTTAQRTCLTLRLHRTRWYNLRIQLCAPDQHCESCCICIYKHTLVFNTSAKPIHSSPSYLRLLFILL